MAGRVGGSVLLVWMLLQFSLCKLYVLYEEGEKSEASCWEIFRKTLGSRLEVLEKLFGSCLEVVWMSLGSRPEVVRDAVVVRPCGWCVFACVEVASFQFESVVLVWKSFGSPWEVV